MRVCSSAAGTPSASTRRTTPNRGHQPDHPLSVSPLDPRVSTHSSTAAATIRPIAAAQAEPVAPSAGRPKCP